MKNVKKIKKILIANRGEIATRVIRTAQEMGIKTAVMYAENDCHLEFVQKADEAYSLGQGDLAETYLNQNKIFEIAKKSGSKAIHPGYGFLSENADFRKRCDQEDLIFIGPTANSMKLMGDKISSKRALEKIQAPLIPGYHGEEQDPEYLLDRAKEIGFPVLIKASAGGGGKGMRIVYQEQDFLESLTQAKSEAFKSFSNDQVLLEKYLSSPRHIEVQVVGDGQGRVLHFYERECSIQRRYQKIIEESPANHISPKARRKICESAVEIAQSIDYQNAGTIEFIMNDKEDFYFLEMNTRLQVEHPITEMVTGYDLVRLQIMVAQGEELPFTQQDIILRGHAIEARIYAEDTDNNFMPSVGIIKYLGKEDRPGVRWDASYRQGDEVSIDYDPMIGKLICYGQNRQSCLEKMIQALNDSVILGFKTNHSFLLRVFRHPSFVAGKVDTLFLNENMDELKAPNLSQEEIAYLIALLEKPFNRKETETFTSLNKEETFSLNKGLWSRLKIQQRSSKERKGYENKKDSY